MSYHPDGSVCYISNEYDHTLDVVSTQTLKVTKQIPLPGGATHGRPEEPPNWQGVYGG